MREQTKQHMRGIIILLPLIVVIILLVMVARPADRYAPPAPKSYHKVERDSASAVAALRAFDPNTADYRTLTESGVPRDIAVAIIRWREAGKVYRIKEDLALCYEMTDSIYYILEPYIIIGKEYQYKKQDYTKSDFKPSASEAKATIALEPFMLDTVTAPYLRNIGFSARQADLVIRYRDMIGGYRTYEEFAECYAVDSAMAERLRPYVILPAPEPIAQYRIERTEFPIEINGADSALLCKVAGIGPKSAQHILFYRELLGGYHSVNQISELKVVTEENFQRILPQICCDSAKIKKININFATSKELEVHPYISNRMLKKIIKHRELKGGWSKLEEMIEDNIFSAEEAMRIAPYLDFSISRES